MADREVQIAWAAGLFEGEGTITQRRKGSGLSQPYLRLSSTDEDVVRRFAAIVGHGAVYGPRVPGRTNVPGAKKPFWEWATGSREGVLAVLGELWPYLGERRQQRASELIELSVKIGDPRSWNSRYSAGLCKNGHDLSDPQHCYTHDKTGKRHCRTCRTIYSRGWRLRQTESC